jgi:putative endonuclease
MDARLGITAWPRGRFVRTGADAGTMTSLSRAEIGALGERLAVDHLTSLGLRVLTRNWRCRYGELDVIAADDTARTVVFVEVKTRTSDQFGGVSQAVTPMKVRRLRRLAALWLATQRGSWAAVRIDVIGVRIGRTRAPEITHLQGVS